MKEIQFTLYEVFGYLLPGAVFCGGLGLLFWAIYFPQPVVEFNVKTVEVWATLLTCAYIGGHVAQAIANKLVRRFESAEEKIITDPKAFPTSLVAAWRGGPVRCILTQVVPLLRSLRRSSADGESVSIRTASPKTPKQWHVQRSRVIVQSAQFSTRSPGIRSKCLRFRVTRVA